MRARQQTGIEQSKQQEDQCRPAEDVCTTSPAELQVDRRSGRDGKGMPSPSRRYPAKCGEKQSFSLCPAAAAAAADGFSRIVVKLCRIALSDVTMFFLRGPVPRQKQSCCIMTLVSPDLMTALRCTVNIILPPHRNALLGRRMWRAAFASQTRFVSIAESFAYSVCHSCPAQVVLLSRCPECLFASC